MAEQLVGSWVQLSTSVLHGYSDDCPELLLGLSGIKTFLFSWEGQLWEANTWGYFWVSLTPCGEGETENRLLRDTVTISDQTGTSLALAWKVRAQDAPSDMCTQGQLVTLQRGDSGALESQIHCSKTWSSFTWRPSLDTSVLLTRSGKSWCVCLSNFELHFCHVHPKRVITHTQRKSTYK